MVETLTEFESEPPSDSRKFDVGSEGNLSPNDDYETAPTIIDELDKGTSKRELAWRAGIARPPVRRIDKHRERYLSRQGAKLSK